MPESVVLVPTLEEQREEGGYYRDVYLDPEKVKLPQHDMPVLWDNDMRHPPVGRAMNIRLEEGRVVADVEMFPGPPEPHSFSVAGIVNEEVSEKNLVGLEVFNVAAHPDRGAR